jgi:hypothetical protein
MIYKVIQDKNIFTLIRNDVVVLVSSQPARVADILHDMLEHKGRLTLIPEPTKGEK